jgi:hypothetical protein
MRGDRRNAWLVLLNTVLLCLGASGAFAQETTGTITGLVTDQTGAILPETSVVVKHDATGRTHELSTNGSRRGNQATEVAEPTIVNQFPIWFDASAFKPNPDGTYGNSGRAPLRLPGRNQTDLALSKNFYPFERRLQFRADFINAFNYTQWTTVNADCSGTTDSDQTCASFPNSTLGQITAARAPREIQLSLKLYW